MVSKSLDEIIDKINRLQFLENFDLIVAIANGGIIPAALINQRLLVKIVLLKLSFRNAKQQPLYNEPQLAEPINFDIMGKKILLVEDRVKTGATLNFAKELMIGADLVKTFAVNGKADYFLYDENCFTFPWLLPSINSNKA